MELRDSGRFFPGSFPRAQRELGDVWLCLLYENIAVNSRETETITKNSLLVELLAAPPTARYRLPCYDNKIAPNPNTLVWLKNYILHKVYTVLIAIKLRHGAMFQFLNGETLELRIVGIKSGPHESELNDETPEDLQPHVVIK